MVTGFSVYEILIGISLNNNKMINDKCFIRRYCHLICYLTVNNSDVWFEPFKRFDGEYEDRWVLY